MIIKKHEYISTESVTIDKDEYIKTVRNISRIVKDSEAYIEEYVAHMNNECVISEMDFRRKYGMSTLKYFHEELNIK